MGPTLQRLASTVRRVRTVGATVRVAPTHVMVLFVLASSASAGFVALWWVAQRDAVDEPLLAADTISLVSETPADESVGGQAASSEPSADGTVVVHVAGAVASEGVVELPAGSRVVDAVAAAGGARRRASTEQLNLARVLLDGEQIYVPAAGDRVASTSGGGTTGGVGGAAGAGGGAVGSSNSAPGGAGVGAAGAAAGPHATLGLNTATEVELATLPGIGPVLAGRIVTYRDQIGGFSAVEQLLEVDGIGEKTFAELRDRVTV